MKYKCVLSDVKNRIILGWETVFLDEKLKYLEGINVNLELQTNQTQNSYCFSHFELIERVINFIWNNKWNDAWFVWKEQ